MHIKTSGGSSVTIDGKTFTGLSIRISGGKVIVDGVTQDGELVGDISVTVNGNCESVENSNGTVEVKGSAGSVRTSNGKVTCGNVGGDVTSSNGTITCGAVSGSVKTYNGNISHK